MGTPVHHILKIPRDPESMKRLGIVLASAFVASVFAGCGGGGIEPGIDKDAATPARNLPDFRNSCRRIRRTWH